ncbi:MAG: hypothetical protein DRI57_17095 [Deltaproteobacteria bacterium]|nr:MAG: hypothetical protein DRI57_17095 [Deltaproteobacteria bacterium]
MKIKKLHFADHPFFGTTDMDFTDRKGRPLNTVAGINGSGKTTILKNSGQGMSNLRLLWVRLMRTWF